MQQKPSTQFVSECGLSKIIVENVMPIGVFHDFLMQVKGLMVERMVKAHQEQVAEMEAQKQIDEVSEQSPAICDGGECAPEPKEA